MDKIVIKKIKIKPKRLCQELTCNRPAETIFKMKHYGKLYLCEDCLKFLLREVILDGKKLRYFDIADLAETRLEGDSNSSKLGDIDNEPFNEKDMT